MLKPGDPSVNYNSQDGFEKYTIQAISSEKVIGKLDLPCYGEAAIIIARGSHMNESVRGEFGRLSHLRSMADGQVVLPLYCSDVQDMQPPDPQYADKGKCVAYVCKWICGFHSKTNKVQFDNLLMKLASAETNIAKQAKSDIQSLFSLTAMVGIKDFQVMIEEETGKLYLTDPRDITNTPQTPPFLKRWSDALDGKLKLAQINDPSFSKSD